MKEYRTIKVLLADKDKEIYDESGWSVEIDDESGGEFVSVRSMQPNCDEGEVKIDPEEWPQLRDLIDRMVKECRP